MQRVIKTNIKSVRLFECGSCENDMKHIRKGAESKKMIFPANVILIRHERGNILFDTGYTRRIYDCGVIGRAYNRLNPTFCTAQDEAVFKLEKIGVSADEIDTVILSHLHPDHIAGLRDFPKARILTSAACISLCRRHRIKDLVFDRLVPDDFFDRAADMESSLKACGDENLGKCYDVFGDGEILLGEVGGHARGQIVMYLPKHAMLFSADMCWSVELAKYIPEMKKVARFVQYDFRQYSEGAAELIKLQNGGISVYPSHQKFEEEILYGDE